MINTIWTINSSCFPGANCSTQISRTYFSGWNLYRTTSAQHLIMTLFLHNKSWRGIYYLHYLQPTAVDCDLYVMEHDLNDLDRVCRVRTVWHGSCAYLCRVESVWQGFCTTNISWRFFAQHIKTANIGATWSTAVDCDLYDLWNSCRIFKLLQALRMWNGD